MLKCNVDKEGVCTWDADGSAVSLGGEVLHLIGSIFCALKQASAPEADLFLEVIRVGVDNKIRVFDTSGYAEYSATVCSDPRK